MRRIILILLLILLMTALLRGEKIGVLTDVLKPEAMEVAGDRLYVVEGATFFVYSLKDLRLVTKFGQKGEGPGELKVFPGLANSIKALPGKLCVEGMTKVIFFSENAKLLKEVKKNWMVFKTVPVGGHFAAVHLLPPGKDQKYYLSLALFDAEMKVIKELYKQEFHESDDEILMVNDSLHFDVYKERIYVEESSRGFFIAVFDSKGNQLYTIKKNFVAPGITKKDKEALFGDLKADGLAKMMVQMKGGWENFKKSMHFIFPGTFPHIQDITVTDDKIYVSTYETKDKKEKYVVMDLKGNVLSTPFVPIPGKSSFTARTMGRDNRFYGIANGKFYYLEENEADEEWELHVTEIKAVPSGGYNRND